MSYITFLGTGTSTGVPQIGCNCEVCKSSDSKDKRFRCSAVVETDNRVILIDCGPDFRMQAIQNDISKVDAVLLTHHHIDHTGGIDDLRPLKDTDIYLDENTRKHVEHMYGYCFVENPYPGVPKLTLHTIPRGEEIEICGLKVRTISVIHGQAPILGFRIGKMAYITDVTEIEEEDYSYLNGLSLCVIGCLRKTHHNTHQTYDQAVEMAKRIGAKQTYFTHMSHDIGLHEVICKETPQNIHFAYDGLKVEY